MRNAPDLVGGLDGGEAVGPDVSPAPVSGRTGAELVALSEHFYDRIFVGAVSFVGLSTLTSLAFLPLRASATDGRPPLVTVGAALVVLILAGVAIWRGHNVYRLLRRRPRLDLVAVGIAAALLSVVSPLRNELWWPACAILMALALLVSLRRALCYCLVVLLANFIAHVVSGDLPETSTVGVVGLWIGLPFWTAMSAVVPDRMASHILSLNAEPRPHDLALPRRISVRTAEAPTDSRNPDTGVTSETSATVGLLRVQRHEDSAAATPRAASRLTSRQLQVVQLLADGYRYLYIAECLSISPRQVHRHVTNAIARLEVQSVNQLVAVAVAEGLVAYRGQRA
jgi:DNA-binding CsgD family transcriptional regulator